METQVTGQHEPLGKPEVKSGAPEGSNKGMKRIHDNNTMTYRCLVSMKL